MRAVHGVDPKHGSHLQSLTKCRDDCTERHDLLPVFLAHWLLHVRSIPADAECVLDNMFPGLAALKNSPQC